MTTVAVVGADGAGKTTVTSRLTATSSVPIKVVYMGVNLEASRVMLPTTRLMLWMKRRRGRRVDMVGTAPTRSDSPPRRRRLVRSVAETVRMTNWMAEEWFRQVVVWWHLGRGRVVVFDRHFLADYHAHDVVGPARGRPLIGRVHGWMLRHLYPRPDLVIVLDAPAELLYARKPESTIEFLTARRQEYLDLANHVPRLEVVDATQPLDAVVDRIAALIVEASRSNS